MKKKNTVQVIAALLFVTITIFFGTLYVYYNNRTAPTKTEMQLYYYDPVSMELIPQKIPIELPESKELKIKKIIEQLKYTPPDSGMFPVINKEADVNSAHIKDGICTIDLNKSATEIQPINVRKEAIRVYGIVNTLTEIPGIKAVRILINGKQEEYFSHYIKIKNPLTHLSTALPQGRDVNLYFASPNSSKLLLEKREIVASQDPITIGKEILRELLFGSADGLKNMFPNDVKINDFYIKSGGVGVVDFSKTILNHNVGSHEEQLLVLSLVNSLTELPDIQSVQILIGGKQVNTLFGSVDTSVPIQRFFGLTQDNTIIVPYYIYTVDDKDFFCPTIETVESDQNQIKALFTALKNPPKSLKTYLPSSSILNSYTMTENASVLNMNISCEKLDMDMINQIEQEITLSFTEIPGVSRVEIIINNGKKTEVSR